MLNKFELNHYPRKYGKTHILVNEMYNFIYKTNAKNKILIYAESEEQVEYISDIITCNLDYRYETTKRYKGKTNNKFISENYVIIVGTYKFHNKNRKNDDSVNLVLFDELPEERNYEFMKNIISKYKNAEFKAYYTSRLFSELGPCDKEFFIGAIIKKLSDKEVENFAKKHEDKLISECSKLIDSIYNLGTVEFTLNEKITIDNFIKKVECLNKKDLTTRNLIQRVLCSSINYMEVNYFGMLLTNDYREKKICKLYDKFKEKLDEFEKG